MGVRKYDLQVGLQRRAVALRAQTARPSRRPPLTASSLFAKLVILASQGNDFINK